MVDISKHPLIRQAYELCRAIEDILDKEGQTVCTPTQTAAVARASELMREIERVVDALPASIAGGRNQQELLAELETLHGVLLLEYHDQNWLAADPKLRNEAKREIVERCLRVVGTTAGNTYG